MRHRANFRRNIVNGLFIAPSKNLSFVYHVDYCANEHFGHKVKLSHKPAANEVDLGFTCAKQLGGASQLGRSQWHSQGWPIAWEPSTTEEIQDGGAWR